MSLTTTTRQHGTAVHLAATAADFAAACQHVLEHGYAKVNSVTIDATTAGMVCAVWKALNEANRIHCETFWQKRIADGNAAKPGDGPAWAVCRTVNLFWKFIK